MWWIEGVRSGGRKKGEKCLLGALAVDCGVGLGWSQRQRGGGGEGKGAGAGQGAGGCAVHSVPQGLPRHRHPALPSLQSCPDLPRGRGQVGFQATDRTDQPR